MAKLNYAQSGVNRDQADELVKSITGMAKKTLDKKVVSHVGGYASIYKLSKEQWIAASTDGVGTKLKLAFEWDAHDRIGQDLVAMSVNDLLCVGSRPLFFLDYFATGKLQNSIAARVINGIAIACKEAGCALVGGETAEMPGMYQEGEYDLAGFAVGSLVPKRALPGKVKAGDILIGIESSGFHSNGYSLIRKILEQSPKHLGSFQSLKERNEALMMPTHLYTRAVLPLAEKGLIQGAAHITGSGFLNVPRMSEKVDYEIQLPELSQRAKVFSWLKSSGLVAYEEIAQTYNLGVGMVLSVQRKDVVKVMKHVRAQKLKVWEIGKVVKKKTKKNCMVTITSEEGTVELKY